MTSPAASVSQSARNSRGSAVVVLVVGVVGFALVALLSGLIATVFATQQVARSAADMAALAGAAQVLASDANVCARAEAMARANQSELSRCTVAGLDVQVEVRHSKVALGQVPVTVTAQARAGPP